jgi:hypothetical protein
MHVSHRHFLQVSLPLFRVCSPSEFSFAIIKPPWRALQLSTSAYSFNCCLTYLSYMTRALACPPHFYTSFIFPHQEKGLGPTVSPLSPANISCSSYQHSCLTMVLSVEQTLMYFGYTYAPNLTHQGASVITKNSSTNGYRNTTSPNTYYFIHSPKNSFQKGTNYTTNYKIEMCRKIQKSAHAPNARMCMKKVTYTWERCIYGSFRPLTHFWSNSQVDLTVKSELNPSGGMVKDLKVPQKAPCSH